MKIERLLDFFIWLLLDGPANDEAWPIALGLVIPSISILLGFISILLGFGPWFLFIIPLSLLLAFGIYLLKEYKSQRGYKWK